MARRIIVGAQRARRPRPRPLALAALLLPLAAGLAGCGLAAGTGGSEARLLVTRDFGTRGLSARIVRQPPSAETAARLLHAATREQGGAARSNGGRAGRRAGDWFLYLNGIASSAGAAAEALHGGDAVWWDRHDAGAAGDVAAVVGSFPEPFAHGAGGKRYPVVLECANDAEAACATVSERLAAAGVVAGRQALGTGVGQDTLRVFVGRWSELRHDQALELLDQGPASGGVYVRFSADGRRMGLLDPRAEVVRTLGAGAGLVAATRFEQQAPTWAITGTDATGVGAAARALGERTLARRFALALDGARAIGLPVVR